MSDDTQSILKPNLEVYYQDGKLFATWQAIELAYYYKVEVKDDIGTVVYSAKITAKDFIPPIILQDDNFQPQDGKGYSVDVYVIGEPSELEQINIVNLDITILKCAIVKNTVNFDWDNVEKALGYDLNIIEKDSKVNVYDKENISNHPFSLDYGTNLKYDVDYSAKLRARNGQSFGKWSNSVEFTLPSVIKILQELRARLIENKTDNSIVLNANTLLAESAGQQETVLKLLQTSFKQDQVTFENAADPILDETEQTLKISGSIKINSKEAIASAIFTVSEEMLLQIELKLILSTDWIFSDSFTSLKDSLLDYVYIKDTILYITSYEHNTCEVFFKLMKGMNLIGKLMVSSSLVPITDTTTDVQTVCYGGFIDYSLETPQFTLMAQDALQDFNINTLGIPAMVMKNGTVILSSQRDVEGKSNINKGFIRGTVSFSSQDITFDLDLPTKITNMLNMYQSQDTLAFSSIKGGIEALGDTEVLAVIPSDFLDITSMSVDNFAFTFDSLEQKVSSGSFAINVLNTEFALLPGKIALSNVIFTFNVSYYPYGGGNLQKTFTGIITGIFNLGADFPVAVTISIPAVGDWTLDIVPQVDKPVLDVIAEFIGKSAQDILECMPQYIRDMTSFNIEQIKVSVDPFTPSLKYISFSMAQVGTWKIVPDILEVYGWKIATDLENTQTAWDTTALLNGKVKLGSSNDAPVINVNMPIPAREQGWTISLADNGVHIPSLENIFYTVGLDDLSTVLPKGIKDLGNIDVSALEFVFDPLGTPIIKSIFFMMKTSESWNIIPDKMLAIDNLQTSFSFINGSGSNGSYVIGYIKGAVTIFKQSIWVTAQRMNITDNWSLNMSLLNPIHIPGLADLSAWMLPQSIIQYIPETFMPFGAGFDIVDLEIAFDLSATNLNMIKFRIKNSELWDVIPSYLSIDGINVEAEIDKPFQEAQGLTCCIQGIVFICSAGIKISAAKASPEAKWVLDGTLIDSVEIDFQELFSQFKMTNVPMPYDFGFPRKITFVSANTSIVPEEQKFHFDMLTKFDWSFSFGPASLKILSVEVALDSEKLDSSGVRPYLLKGNGQFKFCGLDASLGFNVSNKASEKTILVAEVSKSEAEELSLSDMADTLTPQEDTTSKWSNLPIPSTLKAPVFDYLKMYINLTDNIFVVCGNVIGLGAGGFLAQKIQVPTPINQNGDTKDNEPVTEEKWAYLVAAALSKDFKFSNIVPELSIIDSILKINNAGFAISSFETDSISDVIAPVPEMKEVLPAVMPTNPVKLAPGAIIYGELDISGDLFGNIIKLGDNTENKLVIQLYARIDKNSVDTEFSGSVNGFTILQVVKFSSIQFKYYPNKANQFELNGNMIISILQTDYSFNGSLIVNDKTGHFEVETANSIVNPLGMPGITLEKLQLIVDYQFAVQTQLGDNANNAKTDILLGGAVGFGGKDAQGNYPINLAGNILFKNAVAEVVEIELTKPLPVDQLFVTIFTSDLWPQGLLDITFKTGRLYYCNENCQIYNYNYKKGFHLDTLIDIYGFDFAIDADVLDNGINVTGSTVIPIDLGFIQFTDAACSGKGPGIYILVSGSNEEFGLTGGISLFNQKFLSVPNIDYNIKNKEFEGTIAYDGDIDILKGSISFAWNDEKGFRITNWPMSWITQALDYSKLIEQASQMLSSECDKIVDLLFKEIITTKFTIKPKFGSSKSQGELPITLTVSYEVEVVGESIITASLPDITISIKVPKEISFSGIADMIINNLKDNAVSIVKQIFSDNDKLAKFIAAIGITKGTEAIASSLICRGIKNTSSGSGGKSGDDLIDEAKDAADEAEAAAEAGGEAALGTAAGAAAIAGVAAEEAIPIFIAAAAFFGTLIGSFLSWFGIESEEERNARDRKKEQEDKQREAQEAAQRANDAVRKILAIKNMNLVFDRASKKVNIIWDKINSNNLSVNYCVKAYINDTGNVIYSGNMTNSNITLPYSLIGKNNLYVEVYAFFDYSKDGKTYHHVGDTSSQNISIEILNIPQNIVLNYSETKLTGSWKPVQDAENYKAQLLDSSGAPLSVQPVAIYGVNNVIFDGKDFKENDVYMVEVMAEAKDGCSDWSKSQSIVIVNIPTPENLTMRYENNAMTIGWNSVEKAQTYYLNIVDGSTGEIYKTIEAITGLSVVINDIIFKQGTIYKAQLKAVKDNCSSSAAQTVFELLNIPEILKVYYEEGKVYGIWNKVEKASTYGFQLLKESGELVGNVLTNIDETTVAVGGNGIVFAEGEKYYVRVRSEGTDQIGNWSEKTLITIVILEAPQTINLIKAEDGSITTSWSVVSKAQVYTFQVFDNEMKPVVAAVTGLSAPEYLFNPEAIPYVENGIYYLAARGEATQSRGSWIKSGKITQINKPNITKLYYDEGSVVILWTAVTGMQSYLIQLLDDSGSVVISTSVTDISATSIKLDISGKLDGKYTVKIMAIGDNNTLNSPWSDSKAIHFIRCTITRDMWQVTNILGGDPKVPNSLNTSFKGYCAISDRSFTNVNAYDVIAADFIFTDMLEVGSNVPPYIDITIGQNINNTQGGIGYSIGIKGNLSLKALDAGMAGIAAQGDTATALWMNCESTSLAAGNFIQELWGQFIVPEKFNDIPMKNGQNLPLDSIHWVTTMDGDQTQASIPFGPKVLKPGNLNAAYNQEQIQVSWTEVTDANSYDLELMDAAGTTVIKTYEKIVTTSISIDCLELNLSSDTTYSLKVRAEDNRVAGEWTDLKTVTLPSIQVRAQNTANVLFNKKYTPDDACISIKKYFPKLTATDMAKALYNAFIYLKNSALDMAQSLETGGYTIVDTSVAIKALFPAMSAKDLANILMKVFNNPSVVDAANHQAIMLRELGITPQEVASKLKFAYNSLTAVEMAQIMCNNLSDVSASYLLLSQCLKAAQYSVTDTSIAIKKQFPNISAVELANTLMSVFN